MPEEPNEPLPARLLHIAAESVSSVKGPPQEVVVSALVSVVARAFPVHSFTRPEYIVYYPLRDVST